MNKTKKIVTSVVSTVMAGAMLASLAACGPTNHRRPDQEITDRPPHIYKTDNGQAKLTPKTDNGKLSYANTTKVQLAIGYDSSDTGAWYSKANATDLNGFRIASGTVREGDLKPAWSTLQSQLKVTFENKYNGKKSSENIQDIKDNGGLASVTILSASAETINTEGMSNREAFLDFSQYLEYMPNFKAFLEASPIIQTSLIAEAGSGAMYMLPYFDGNDDIEKFVIMRKDIVAALLNGASGENLDGTITFKAQADAKNNATSKGVISVEGTKSSAASFMGTTGSWEVDTTDPSVLTANSSDFGSDKTVASDSKKTVKVKVNYDAALKNAKSTAAGDIGAILKTVTGVTDADVSGQTSGNIVDIMNLAINKSAGAVKGGQLLQILRKYIDVAYQTASGAAFYADSNSGLKRADVFNSASAAWDADLYTALGRCFVTCGSLLGEKVKDAGLTYLVAGRQYTTQRTTDVGSLAGELYGARGLESRYNYTYISSNGDVKDGRSNENFYDALVKINDLAKEGLFNTADNVTNGWASVNHNSNTGIQTLSIHDYIQTQTANYGFSNDSSYNFAPVLTPVSQWDTNDDGKAETIMRFTESWRSVKDGGLAISYENVKNDPDKLSAALAFVDYCYSGDGQILMTYGPQSTYGNVESPNGTWYATEVTNKKLDEVANKIADETIYAPAQYKMKDAYKEQYFVYNGKLYTGTPYNGRQIPTMTSEFFNVFNNKGHNFTNVARKYYGTTIQFNKDQGFEYQCTAPCGLAGSKIVNVALVNGTIKHQFQTIDEKTYWYTVVPTQLPYDSATTEALGAAPVSYISGKGADNNNAYVSTSKTKANLILDLMYYGYDASRNISSIANADIKLPANAADAVKIHNEKLGLTRLRNFKRIAWFGLLDWYYDDYAEAPAEK